jgi:anti-sigma B factor antagonist
MRRVVFQHDRGSETSRPSEVATVALPFRVDSYEFDGGRVVVPRGEIDAATSCGLAEHLTGPLGSLVVIDLLDVSFLDSSGLGAIHVGRRNAIEHGGNLVVCRPTSTVRRVFEITGLDTWFADWDPRWSNGTRSEVS